MRQSGECVHFSCVTSLRVEGKQMLTAYCVNQSYYRHGKTQKLRQRGTKYCRWEIMLKVRQENASLRVTPPTPLIPLPFTSNGFRAH